MPSDEEFRRVAEDLRGLARSLGRELRDAADQIRHQTRASRGYQQWGPGMPGPPPPGAQDAGGETTGPDGQPAGDGNGAAQPGWRGGPGWWSWTDSAGRTWSSEQFAWRGRHRHRHGWGPPNGWGPPTGAATGTATAPPPAPTGPPRHQRRDRPPRPPIRHKRDGSTLIGGLALVFGLAWLISRTHLASVSAEVVIALALLVVGGAMVVTARTDWALSRKMWPAVVGAVLVIAAIGTSPALGVPISWHDLRVGTHSVQYSTWDSVPAVYRGGIGKTTLDLSGLPAAPDDHHIDVTATVGQLVIKLPPHMHVVVDAEMAFGDIQVNGEDADNGIRPEVHQEFGSDAGGGTLTIHAKSGPGNLRIEAGVPVKP